MDSVFFLLLFYFSIIKICWNWTDWWMHRPTNLISATKKQTEKKKTKNATENQIVVLINDFVQLLSPSRRCVPMTLCHYPIHIFELFRSFMTTLCSFSLFSSLLFIFIRFGRSRRDFHVAPNSTDVVVGVGIGDGVMCWRIGKAENCPAHCTT